MSNLNSILGSDDILGARRRKKVAALRRKIGPSKLNRLKSFLARRKAKGLSTVRRASAKKPILKSLWARLSPAKRQAAVAAMIRKNPKLKKKLAVAILQKRIEERKSGLVTSPAAPQRTPVAAKSPVTIMPDPASAAIPEEETQSTAEAVQDEMEQGSLDDAANAEAAEQEGAEDAAEETAADATESAEADAAEMSEETPEEAQEEASEAADDASEAVSESAGDLLLGYLKGKGKRRRRLHGHIRRCVNAAKPLAGEVERLSGGEIQAQHLLGAVKLIAKAKKGDVKAKKGIKAVTKLASKKGPKQKVAKKAAAKLKIAHKIMKKTGMAKGTSAKKKRVLAKKAKKVRVYNSGLASYSAYQRGMAMIPKVARSHFGA